MKRYILAAISKKMPYTMRRSRRGCQVTRGRKTFSKKPISCWKAERQIRLLRAVERGWKPTRRITRRNQRNLRSK